MTVRHPVSDLATYALAKNDAGMAYSAMCEAIHGDPANLDRLHRAALAAHHRMHAAAAVLGLNALCPHPLRAAEVADQAEAAKVSIYQLRKAEKKANARQHE